VLVRRLGDDVARGDDRLDLIGRAGGRDGQAIRPDLRRVAGRELRGLRRLSAGRGGTPSHGRAQRIDVRSVDGAVDPKGLLGLEELARLVGARADLAVDLGREAGATEEVLEHADVVTAHPLLDRDAIAEAAVLGGGFVGIEAAVLVGARAAERALEGGGSLAPD